MSVAVVTGSAGLIGSEAARRFHEEGWDVVGLDNNMREYFFGADGSTLWNRRRLEKELKRYRHVDADIRDRGGLESLFKGLGRSVACVIHAAGQPSHDWAAREPHTDFEVNALGTLNLLEAVRRHCPAAAFAFLSTNKVYGDSPNRLPLVEGETRYELAASHPFAESGIDETMSIDQSLHSLFGASKAAADLLVQEYGRYFGLATGVFRGGTLTGPAHSGAELHGFLAYLVKCAVSGRPYTVFGHKGKQVRDVIHSEDLVEALWRFCRAPRPAAVYNMGGGRHSHCSVLEAIALVERLSGRRLSWRLSPEARVGDHVWWISDVRAFQRDYPGWTWRRGLEGIARELIEAAGRA